MSVIAASLENLPLWALVLLLVYLVGIAAFVWFIRGIAIGRDPWEDE